MYVYLAGLIHWTLRWLTIFHPSPGHRTRVHPSSRAGAAPLESRLRVHLLSLMRRVPTLQACLSLRRGAWDVLARRRGRVGLLSLPSRLGVGDGLRRLDLDAEPGPGGSGGCGVGGWDGLRVGLWARGGVVVLLVGGGVLR